MLSEGAVSWNSKKQECVALSTAELRQNVYTLLCLMLYKSLFGSRQLITELGSPFEMPIMIFEDNQSVIAMTKTPLFHGRAKHVDIKHHVSQGTIKLDIVPQLR